MIIAIHSDVFAKLPYRFTQFLLIGFFLSASLVMMQAYAGENHSRSRKRSPDRNRPFDSTSNLIEPIQPLSDLGNEIQTMTETTATGDEAVEEDDEVYESGSPDITVAELKSSCGQLKKAIAEAQTENEVQQLESDLSTLRYRTEETKGFENQKICLIRRLERRARHRTMLLRLPHQLRNIASLCFDSDAYPDPDNHTLVEWEREPSQAYWDLEHALRELSPEIPLVKTADSLVSLGEALARKRLEEGSQATEEKLRMGYENLQARFNKSAMEDNDPVNFLEDICSCADKSYLEYLYTVNLNSDTGLTANEIYAFKRKYFEAEKSCKNDVDEESRRRLKRAAEIVEKDPETASVEISEMLADVTGEVGQSEEIQAVSKSPASHAPPEENVFVPFATGVCDATVFIHVDVDTMNHSLLPANGPYPASFSNLCKTWDTQGVEEVYFSSKTLSHKQWLGKTTALKTEEDASLMVIELDGVKCSGAKGFSCLNTYIQNFPNQ